MHEAPAVRLEDLSTSSTKGLPSLPREGLIEGSPAAPTAADALPLVLTVEEVAALLRVERRHIYGLVARKTLPGAFYLGRALRFNRDTVLGWLARDGQGRVRRKA